MRCCGLVLRSRDSDAGDHAYERDGIRVEGRKVPVDRAGCYVPGGRAIYPSTVLMTAIAAKVATMITISGGCGV